MQTVSTKKHRGILGSIARYSGAEFAGNIGKDIGETAVGVLPGIYAAGKAEVNAVKKTIEHPIVSGKNDPNYADKQIAPLVHALEQQYKDYYGHDLLHHLYTHPLQPALDAATVLSGGVGAVAKAGKLGEAAGIAKASKLADLGRRGETTTRSPRAVATGEGPTHTALTSATPAVKLRQQVVAAARARFPEGKVAVKGKAVRLGGGEVKQFGSQIQERATQRAQGRLTPYEAYFKATKHLSKDEWTALHLRAIDVHPQDLVQVWKGRDAAKVAADPKIRALVLSPSARMVVAEPELRALSRHGEKLYRQHGKLTQETAAARPDLTKRQASEMLGRPVKAITGEPYYFPHVYDQQPVVSPLAAAGGGKAPPRKLGSMKQSTGTLAMQGKLHLRGDILGPEFLRRVKYVKYDEIHKGLVRGAVPITRQQIDAQGGRIPSGWEYIRQNASTRIPPGIRGQSEQTVPIEQLIPNPDSLHDSQLAKDGFSTANVNEAHSVGGHYYIVPKSTVKAATGEFTRSSNFVHHFVRRPLSVWRAVVLGLRVGFLTNNLVGNSLMYTAKTGGNGALRDLFGAILETHGRETGLKVLNSQATPPELRRDLYREFFPEQVHGTFGLTQSPANSTTHVVGRKALEAGRTATGALPRLTSKIAEEYPRRALIRNAIRNSPEFKRVYATLPKQTRTFDTAARHLLSGKGGQDYQRLISKHVNDALGDYLGLSPFERNVMRNTLPFYAWYKAITTTTAHLAADTPLRANILGQIGRIGKEQSDAALGEVPSFLRGAIPLGDGANGTKKVLATQSLNPYATLEQLRRGITTDVSDLGVNPFLMGGMEAYAKLAGRGKSASVGEVLAQMLYAMGRGLPPARVAFPTKPSQLYPNRNRRSEFLSYLGAPIKEYNPAAAAQQAQQGR